MAIFRDVLAANVAFASVYRQQGHYKVMKLLTFPGHYYPFYPASKRPLSAWEHAAAAACPARVFGYHARISALCSGIAALVRIEKKDVFSKSIL